MSRKTLIVALLALLTVLLTTNKLDAWGAYHVGYTHVGPSGAYHYGRTEVGGYGRYGGYDRYGYGDRYRSYGGYGYGGYHYGAYGAGVYRRY
jgi:hypothetical protein